MSLSGDTAFVGAFRDSHNGEESGSSFLFTRSGGIWSQKAKLVPNDGADYDEFGFSVALSGAHALAGAHFDDDAGGSSGTGYFFNLDIDNDGQLNVDDLDHDADGLLDSFEITYGFNHYAAGDELLDPDGDGVSNLQEQAQATNPVNPDSDSDGLSDGSGEQNAGTDPLNPDSDGDGLLDGFEVDNGFNPLLVGEENLDPDNDHLTNIQEQIAGTDPHNPDSDGDGYPDGFEVNEYGTDPLDETDIPVLNEENTPLLPHAGYWLLFVLLLMVRHRYRHQIFPYRP